MAYFARGGPADPDVAHRAVVCATYMFHAADHLINPIITRSGLDPLYFRICIDQGWITVARFGAAQRFNHIVAVGSVANRTSKMLAKATPGELLLGDLMLDGLPAPWVRDHVVLKTYDTGWDYHDGRPYGFWLFRGRWIRDPEPSSVAAAPTLSLREPVADQAAAPHEPAARITGSLGRLHADFANFHEGYVRHYIALADTKATVVFGLASSVIAFLFARKAYHDLLFEPARTWQTGLAYLVALLLLAGAGCAAWTIAPRLPHTGDGLVFFGAVRRHTDGYEYAAAIGREDEAGLALARLRHCYDVSGVCWRKYISLRRALWLTVAGITAALPLLA